MTRVRSRSGWPLRAGSGGRRTRGCSAATASLRAFPELASPGGTDAEVRVALSALVEVDEGSLAVGVLDSVAADPRQSEELRLEAITKLWKLSDGKRSPPLRPPHC
jgi:hypothetical protein